MTSVPRAKLHITLTDILTSLVKALITKKSRDNLEQEFLGHFANECHLNEKHTIMAPSCRVALFLLLEALKLPPGSLIALTPLTIPDIVNAILIAGHKPYFVDLDPETHNIAEHEVLKLSELGVKAAVLAHLSGIYNSQVQNSIYKLKALGIYVIEDISQAYASENVGIHAGELGDAFIGSLSLGKVVTAIGGGVLGVSDFALFERVSALSQLRFHTQLTPKKIYARYLYQHIKISILTKRLLFDLLTINVLKVASRFKSTDEIFRSKKREKNYPYDNPSLLREKFPSCFFYQLRKSQILIALKTLQKLRAGIAKRNELKSLYVSASTNRSLLPRALSEDNLNTLWHFPLNLSPNSYKKVQKFLLSKKIDTCGYLLRNCNSLSCFSAYQRELPGLKQVSTDTIFIPIHEHFSPNQIALITSSLELL